MKRECCPNCGKKGFYKMTKNSLPAYRDTTHKCYYCDMEFKKVKRKGELSWRGEIPRYTIA